MINPFQTIRAATAGRLWQTFPKYFIPFIVLEGHRRRRWLFTSPFL